MDDQGSGGTPLDDDFVRAASQHESSHRERQLAEQLRRAEQRQRSYRLELERGLQERRRAQRRRPTSVRLVPGMRRGSDGGRRRELVGWGAAALFVVACLHAPGRLLGPATGAKGLPIAVHAGCPASVSPAGAGYSFEYCAGSQPVGWPRCSTVTVAIDPSGAPAGWRSVVDDATTQLSAATHLHFRLVDGSADVHVGWSSTLPATPDRSDAVGVTQTRVESDLLGTYLTAARVTLLPYIPGRPGATGELPVLLHELGHAVGLGHSAGEVMDPVDHGLSAYQPGDIAGLARLYPSCA